MKNTEGILLISIALFVLAGAIFLEGTITGKISQSMHCDDDDCYTLCRSDAECPEASRCCEKDGLGVCQTQDECNTLFSPDLDINVDLDNQPNVESPSQIVSPLTYLLLISIAGTILALIYLENKKTK